MLSLGVWFLWNRNLLSEAGGAEGSCSELPDLSVSLCYKSGNPTASCF